MTLPLDTLINQRSEIYLITCAAIKRANQLTLAGDEELADPSAKVVPLALKQVLNKQVLYRIEEQ